MRNLVRILKSLSNETRLRMLNMLFERDCCVCEIMQVLGISQPCASNHLISLYNAGLLQMRRQGLFSLYSIDWGNLDAYAVDLIRAVRKGLEGNELAQADLRKLSTVERVLPDCAKVA
jgi:ArsR family transcriptional regulator